MAIDTTKKIKQVTYNGKEIPLSGYDTSDATVTAGDMARNVIAYGKNGKMTGTLPSVSTVFGDATSMSKIGNVINIDAQLKLTKRILKQNPTISITVNPGDFGNATVADVAKGKIFTSAAGFKVTGTAEGSSAADVTFELYNNGFDNLAVVYMSKTDGVMQTTIPNSDHMPITTSEGSMVALVNQGFDGNTINLVPDNGVSIAQGWRTANITMFVAGAETNGMNIDVEIV